MVCDGRGVFANVFLPRGSYVTAYAGNLRRSRSIQYRRRQYNGRRRYETRRNNVDSEKRDLRDSSTFDDEDDDVIDYCYSFSDGDRLIDGSSRGRNFRCAAFYRDGIAHLANDAVHEDVTGNVCNCVFREARRRVYLVTRRDVEAGEELLVPYCLGYWLRKIRSRPSALPEKLRAWLRCHSIVEDLLYENAGGRRIVDFVSFSFVPRSDGEEGRGTERAVIKYRVEKSDGADAEDTNHDGSDTSRCSSQQGVMQTQTAGAESPYSSSLSERCRCSESTWTLSFRKSVETAAASASASAPVFDVDGACHACGRSFALARGRHMET